MLNSVFGAAKLTKYADLKYFYSGYDVGCYMHETFPLPDESGFGKNVLIFGVDSSSYFHADNRNKDILVLGKGPTD